MKRVLKFLVFLSKLYGKKAKIFPIIFIGLTIERILCDMMKLSMWLIGGFWWSIEIFDDEIEQLIMNVLVSSSEINYNSILKPLMTLFCEIELN